MATVIACSEQRVPPPSSASAEPVKVVVTPPAPSLADAANVLLDRRHRLDRSEGVISAAPLHGSLGRPIAAPITVTPATDYQINTDLQPHLELAPPAAVDATPVRLAHWDHDQLALVLEVTAHEPGAYAIHGTLHFAVCKRELCFPKDEPIELALDVR
ncbi:hypothetical protein BH11MYX1_BH11MYX1_41550 [soil metagenome]